MSQRALFTVLVSSDLPDAERERLLLTLRTVVDIQEPTSRVFGAEWITFVAIMKDVGVLAGAAAGLVKLANEISTWRRNARQRGIEPKVTLQHPNKDALELETATDEEMQTWLLQKQ